MNSNYDNIDDDDDGVNNDYDNIDDVYDVNNVNDDDDDINNNYDNIDDNDDVNNNYDNIDDNDDVNNNYNIDDVSNNNITDMTKIYIMFVYMHVFDCVYVFIQFICYKQDTTPD